MNDTIIGALIVFVSGLATLVVKEIFEARKTKEDHRYLYEKEYLTTKQEKAEEILKAIQIYRDVFNEQFIQLQYKNINWAKQTPEYFSSKFNGLKEKMAINLYLYFPDIEDKYYEFANQTQKLNNQISEILKKRTFEEKDAMKFDIIYKNYQIKDGIFAKAIIDHIRRLHKGIVK